VVDRSTGDSADPSKAGGNLARIAALVERSAQQIDPLHPISIGYEPLD
jgi:hypothetical protein